MRSTLPVSSAIASLPPGQLGPSRSRSSGLTLEMQDLTIGADSQQKILNESVIWDDRIFKQKLQKTGSSNFKSKL